MKDKKTLTEIDKILTEFNFDRMTFDDAKERLYQMLHPPQTELCKHTFVKDDDMIYCNKGCDNYKRHSVYQF